MKTIEEIAAEEKAAHAKWAAETLHGEYTIAALHAAFAKVAPRPNWKTAIKASVPASEAKLTAAAITFMVGGACKVSPAAAGFVWIENAGYYANIGA